MASNLPTSKSPSEEAREARKAHNLRGERGCRKLILENWDVIEDLHGPNADARQAKRVVDRNRTEDDPAPQAKNLPKSDRNSSQRKVDSLVLSWFFPGTSQELPVN